MNAHRTNGSSTLELGPEKVKHLMARALACSAADETEITFTAINEALTRFSHNTIHQNVAERDATIEVRAVLGSRVGTATTNDLSELGLERVTRTACELAQHLPENPHWPGLPEPQTYPAVAAFDADVAALCDNPQERARAVADLCARARAASLAVSGSYSAARYEYALLNSKGLFAYAPNTQVDVTFVAEQAQPHTSAYAHATGWRLGQIDFEELAHTAFQQASTLQAPRHVPRGEYSVVLEPYAVLTLLEAMIENGMGALAVQEERSWMCGHLGQPSLSPYISIVDDALAADGLPRAFDCEGWPKQRVEIVRAGVPLSPVYDRVTAAREPHKTSTGHAQPYDDEDWDGPAPENLTVAFGTDAVPELIAKVKRGLYINRFWYVRQTASHRAAATGTTRDAVWWIENGELAYPVHNLRFDQELVTALQHVIGVGQNLHTLSGFYGVHRVPALALDGFRFIASDEREP
ncbi:MAG: TldD/PmbA family protein [Anaerolineales bacterium]|nr:TldD/PmbA family protein [Anaerolineales bacterium]